MAIDEPAETVPGSRHRAFGKPGKRRRAKAELLGALGLVMLDDAQEHVFHQARGSFGQVAHQIHRQALPVCRRHDIGEGDDLPVLANDGDIEMVQPGRIEATDREPLLVSRLAPQPGIGHRTQIRHQRRVVRGLLQGEVKAFPPAPVRHRAHVLEPPARQVESRQVDHGFFADLVQRQPEFDPERQVATADLVKDRPAIGPRRLIGKGPAQRLELCRIADRIAKRNP